MNCFIMNINAIADFSETELRLTLYTCHIHYSLMHLLTLTNKEQFICNSNYKYW